MRPTRQQLHMSTALIWGRRSTCKRYSVGCVITNDDMRQILAFGYNGPAKGRDPNVCRDTQGSCGCVHAEANAVAFVDGSIKNKVAFTTVSPCENCANLLINSNVTQVYYLRSRETPEGQIDGRVVLGDAHVPIEPMSALSVTIQGWQEWKKITGAMIIQDPSFQKLLPTTKQLIESMLDDRS